LVRRRHRRAGFDLVSVGYVFRAGWSLDDVVSVGGQFGAHAGNDEEPRDSDFVVVALAGTRTPDGFIRGNPEIVQARDPKVAQTRTLLGVALVRDVRSGVGGRVRRQPRGGQHERPGGSDAPDRRE
jgi:hypothetical protein